MMNNLYNQSDVNGILDRLEKLSPDAERKWGKMNIGQYKFDIQYQVKIVK